MKPLLRTATVVGLTVLAAAGCGQKAPPAEPVRAVRTLVVSDVQSMASHEYAAEVRARTESRLGFRVGGKLQSRAVNLGDAVKRGQVLAQLDGQDLRLAQQAATASLAAAQTNLDQVSADARRFRELREQGFISGAELERRDTAVKTAKAQMEQARAQASVQGNQAGYASLVADASGVVTGVEAEPGQVVAAGTPVVRLAHDGPRDAVFSVPEDRAAAVRQLRGQPGAVTLLPWSGGEPIKATVREVAAAADPITRTFQVKADIGAAPLALGQTATIRLPGPTVAGVIRLPLSAVVEHKGQTAVWVLDRQQLTVATRPVVVGGADGNAVVVRQGLKAGDEVVVAGTHVLTPGLRVKRFAEPAASAPQAATNVSMPAASAVAAQASAPATVASSAN